MVTFDKNTTRQSKMTSRIIKSLENVDSEKYQEPKKIPVLDECDINLWRRTCWYVCCSLC